MQSAAAIKQNLPECTQNLNASKHHKYTDTASIYASSHIYNYANTPHGPNFTQKKGIAANGKGQMSVQRGAANKAPDMTVI